MKIARLLIAISVLLTVPHVADATTFSTLANFNSTNGATPSGKMIIASDGNFYGTTYIGGASNLGAVFKVTPSGTLTAVASFNNANGKNPQYGVIQASDGNFYGTTPYGGASGDGAIFKMTPSGTLTNPAYFTYIDGTVFPSGLIQASDKNFYGTTYYTGGYGTVFKMTLAGTLTTLVSMDSTHGILPESGVIQGSDGNLYGTAIGGGTSSDGTVFQVTLAGALSTVVNFNNTNGNLPQAGLIQDSNGYLYGATNYGGSSTAGTIYKVTTGGSLTTLVNYGGSGALTNALIQASDGNFYGAAGGGTFFGTARVANIFKMTPAGVLTPLMNLPAGVASSSLVQGADGSLYGTTDSGGTSNLGTVYRFNATASENIAFSSATTVPITTTAFTITGSALNVTLNYAPTAGTVLTAINNTGASAISGRFTNLPDGGTITATYNSVTYTFTANYEGGDGNDLTLTLPQASVAPAITSAASTTFTAGLNGNFSVTATGSPAPTFGATGLPAWASLNSTTGVLGGTPPTTGKSSYPITITATNGTVPDATQNFNLGVIDPFAQWEAQTGFFSPAQIADPTISGPSAIPQKDGYANLLKYLFDINPAQPISYTDRAALPTVAIDTTTTPGTPYLTLTYRQYSLKTGITVNVQTSTNLQSWTTVTPDLSQQVGTDAVTGDPIMEVGVKTNGVPKLYIRFNVTMP